MMTNDKVIDRWIRGGHGQSQSMSTDGVYIYSYNELVGKYGPSDDHPIIYNFRKKDGGTFISITTSKHVTQIINAVTKIINRQPLLINPNGEENDVRRTSSNRESER